MFAILFFFLAPSCCRHERTLKQFNIVDSSFSPGLRFHDDKPNAMQRDAYHFEHRPTPAAATIFGRGEHHLSFPTEYDRAKLLRTHSAFFEEPGMRLQPRPDFTNLTDLTLDLRRRTLHMSNTFTKMTKLVSLDIAFSNVACDGDSLGSEYDDETGEEVFFKYAHLQHLTLRFAPCYVTFQDAQEFNRKMEHDPPESLYPLFGCEGSRADMGEWMQERLGFFIAASCQLRSLRLLHELELTRYGIPHKGDTTQRMKAYGDSSGWPLWHIANELMDESNLLERLVIEHPTGSMADGEDVGLLITMFQETLQEIDITFCSSGDWCSIENDLITAFDDFEGANLRRVTISRLTLNNFWQLDSDEERSRAQLADMLGEACAPCLKRGLRVEIRLQNPAVFEGNGAMVMSQEDSSNPADWKWKAKNRTGQSTIWNSYLTEPSNLVQFEGENCKTQPPVVSSTERYDQDYYNSARGAPGIFIP